MHIFFRMPPCNRHIKELRLESLLSGSFTATDVLGSNWSVSRVGHPWKTTTSSSLSFLVGLKPVYVTSSVYSACTKYSMTNPDTRSYSSIFYVIHPFSPSNLADTLAPHGRSEPEAASKLRSDRGLAGKVSRFWGLTTPEICRLEVIFLKPLHGHACWLTLVAGGAHSYWGTIRPPYILILFPYFFVDKNNIGDGYLSLEPG